MARVADGWINSAKITLEEAQAMRQTIETARQAMGTSGRPFQYFVRPHTPEAADVAGYAREGFDNIVLWGPDVWPNDPAVPLETKVAGLEATARELGVSARVAELA